MKISFHKFDEPIPGYVEFFQEWVYNMPKPTKSLILNIYKWGIEITYQKGTK